MSRIFAAALASLLLAGCATRVEPGRAAPVAPTLSVERFLQAANARDLEAMSRLFGTASGPVSDTGSTFGCAFKRMGSWIGLGERCVRRTEVELRMNAIAVILRHDDYRVVSEGMVPGRRNPTTRVGVNLVQGQRTVTEVPFVVVQTGQGRWLIEEIGLERITGRR